MTKLPKLKDRILNLAKVLAVTATEKITIEKDLATQIWWLRGCVEGDQPLPGTRGCGTIQEALENVEGWLAPEFDKIFNQSKEKL